MLLYHALPNCALICHMKNKFWLYILNFTKTFDFVNSLNWKTLLNLKTNIYYSPLCFRSFVHVCVSVCVSPPLSLCDMCLCVCVCTDSTKNIYIHFRIVKLIRYCNTKFIQAPRDLYKLTLDSTITREAQNGSL